MSPKSQCPTHIRTGHIRKGVGSFSISVKFLGWRRLCFGEIRAEGWSKIMRNSREGERSHPSLIQKFVYSKNVSLVMIIRYMYVYASWGINTQSVIKVVIILHKSQHKRQHSSAIPTSLPRRTLNAEVRIQSRASLCDICGSRSCTGTLRTPSISLFPRPPHFINTSVQHTRSYI